LTLCVPAIGFAGDAATAVYKFEDGIGGPSDPMGEEDGEDYAGPGTEQSTVEYILKGGHVYIVTVWMSSNVDNADRPWQLKCSSMVLTKNAAPALVADAVQITDLGDDNNADERPANHPHLEAIGANLNYFAYSFGSDDNNGNVQTYVGILNEMCEVVQEPLRISNNDNNNQGAPECAWHGNGRLTCGYYDNNDQRTYARGLTLDETNPAAPQLSNNFLTVVVAPADIGRPTIVAPSAERAFLCAAKGANRPPEDGVECALINALDGEVLFRQYIHESEPGNNIYFNQPAVAMVGTDIGILTVSSSGDGKDTNDKGESETYYDVVEVTDAGMQIKSTRNNIGPYQTHPGMCSARFGVVNTAEDMAPYHAVMFQAPITGAGQPAVQYVDYDAVSKAINVDTNYKYWTAGWYGDAGYLPNIYGQNPNDQGRDYLRCAGNVPNPAFGVAGGFKSTIRSFVAAPHSGRMYGDEPKNALWFSLVPAESNVALTPEAPETPQNPETTEPPPDTETDPANPNDPIFGPPQKGGCACNAVGQNEGRDGSLALMALGLGLLLAGRRRREV
jgi:MYXO-CTERM domain-containing protein